MESAEPAVKFAEQSVALVEAIRTERPKLLGFIRTRVRTEEDAEDIVQDVLYQLAASYSVTEPIERLTAWLFAVARNKIIDWYRKRKPLAGRDPKTFQDAEAPDGPLNLEDILFDPADSPDEVYYRSVVWTELAEALEELPEDQRSVFVMHEFEGKSFKEMAEITGESMNTLLSRKRYAVLYLRERLQELYTEMKTL